MLRLQHQLVKEPYLLNNFCLWKKYDRSTLTLLYVVLDANVYLDVSHVTCFDLIRCVFNAHFLQTYFCLLHIFIRIFYVYFCSKCRAENVLTAVVTVGVTDMFHDDLSSQCLSSE